MDATETAKEKALDASKITQENVTEVREGTKDMVQSAQETALEKA